MDIRYETPFGVFEWNGEKNAANIRKHGIDFRDAAAAFEDASALFSYDGDSSDDEDRYRLTGRMEEWVIAVIVFTDRVGAVRIISARKATSNEQRTYYERSNRH
ncbi:MAG: BrnT family toxin [Desulfovibrio sp.]|nr:BrnT family toxin [Desulfovibrio sp.]